ncbi:MAG TPA: hypothetical protein VMH23_19105, partial [Bacteroidota bacterium]|nr:hypothetical protein [Bacteroidota bacterium]
MLLRLTILFSILAPLSLRAQHLFDIPSGDTRHAALFIISKSDSAYTLPHTFVVPGSEKVLFDSTRTLRRGTDYEIQYYGGTIWLRRAFRSEIPGDSSTHRITISYDTPPYSLLREYSLHRVTSLRDSSGATIGKVEPTLSRFSMDDV